MGTLFFRPLPWHYGVRNLFRRPMRSLLTLAALALVAFLVVVVVAFLRGLDSSLTASGDERVVLVHSLGASENIENSTVPGNAAGLLRASVAGIAARGGEPYISPELYMGTQIRLSPDDFPRMGLMRGITPAAALVRKRFQLRQGDWPRSGEVVIGSLVGTKLAVDPADLAVGSTILVEGRSWRIAGWFSAGGTSLESEIWCPLEDLQAAVKRQDYTLVAVTMATAGDLSRVDEFCKERLDLEWEATPEATYYSSLQRHYGPVRTVSWLVVALIAAAGAFGGLNTMYGAVVGRVHELAALQTIGFSRRAIVLSILQEGILLGTAASLLATGCALFTLNDAAIRFTMGAFQMRVDHLAVAAGLLCGAAIGLVGSIPPALRALRLPVAEALKAL